MTLNTESPRIPRLYSEADINILGPTRARGAISKYLTNDDLSCHCGTGERQKYDDLSGTQEIKAVLLFHIYQPHLIFCEITT